MGLALITGGARRFIKRDPLTRRPSSSEPKGDEAALVIALAARPQAQPGPNGPPRRPPAPDNAQYQDTPPSEVTAAILSEIPNPV